MSTGLTAQTLRDVDGFPGGAVWAVGDQGTIFEWRWGVWMERSAPTFASLRHLTRCAQEEWSALVPPLQEALHPLLAQVEACTRVEDVELMPSILAGSRETSEQASPSISGRYRTSDDVARTLRQRLPEAPEPEPKPAVKKRRGLYAGGRRKLSASEIERAGGG